jgi:hypothetical protein
MWAVCAGATTILLEWTPSMSGTSPAILKESERLHFLDSQGQLGMIPFGDEAD